MNLKHIAGVAWALLVVGGMLAASSAVEGAEEAGRYQGPSVLAASKNGKTLFVANADNNCVMVADISNSISEEARRNRESVSVVEGFIPVGDGIPGGLGLARIAVLRLAGFLFLGEHGRDHASERT